VRRHWFFILLSLAERDRHGSAIMRDVLALTDGELRLWPVTLYGSLEELREQGLIRAVDAPAEDAADVQAEMQAGEGARRKWFRISAAGRRALAAEVQQLEGLVRVAQSRLVHTGDAP
jgi:DNA-binding PadR family transcriptional regulator